MGIGGNFWDLLKPCARFESVDFLREKRVAVDLSFWIVQHDAAVKSAGGRRPVRKPHLRLTFFRTVNLFSKMGAYPLFVADGEAPWLKRQARVERFFRASGLEPSALAINLLQINEEHKFKRNSFFTECVQECVELLELMGMPVLRAEGEAEALCAQLNADGGVDFCITADSDAFLFGAKSVIKCMNSNSKEPFECYNMSDIKSKLGLTRRHLIAISLLVGNDYDLHGVPGIGVDSAVRLVRLFQEDEVLQRLVEIGKKESHWLTSQTPSKTRLPPHCERCGHPGSKRAHLTSPCRLCEVSKDGNCTLKLPGFKCGCPVCQEARQSKEQKKQESWRIRVCQRISTELDFPNMQIMNIYLNSCSDFHKEAQALQWREPKVEDLADFMSFYLNWSPSYTRQRLLPMLTTIFLREVAARPGKESLLCCQCEFHSIQRMKTRFSHPFYVVKWKRLSSSLTSPNLGSAGGQPIDFLSETEESLDASEEIEPPSVILEEGSWFLVTDENVQLVKAAFPEAVDRFHEEKRESKPKTKRMAVTTTPRSGEKQLSIKEFYRSTKTPQKNSEKRPRPLSIDQCLSKSVRRRLLFE